jgi:hypothetical protein
MLAPRRTSPATIGCLAVISSLLRSGFASLTGYGLTAALCLPKGTQMAGKILLVSVENHFSYAGISQKATET